MGPVHHKDNKSETMPPSKLLSLPEDGGQHKLFFNGSSQPGRQFPSSRGNGAADFHVCLIWACKRGFSVT